MDDALSEVAVASCVKEDLIELDRQRNILEDEKKTLESLLIEARDEATSTRTRFEHECARMKAVNEQLELENRGFKIHQNKAECLLNFDNFVLFSFFKAYKSPAMKTEMTMTILLDKEISKTLTFHLNN